MGQAFTLNDLRRQIEQLGRMGLPNFKLFSGQQADQFADDLRRVLGILDAMTPEERNDPFKLNDLRRRMRIAFGAGVDEPTISEPLAHFRGIAEMMSRLPE